MYVNYYAMYDVTKKKKTCLMPSVSVFVADGAN